MIPTTDYHALCAEMLQAWDDLPWEYDFKGDPVGPFAGIDDTPFERARAALAQPEPVGPTDEELDSVFHEHCWTEDDLMDHDDFVKAARAVLARWGRPAIEPVPVSERFDFSVLDSEYEEQAGGTAPTYSQALSEGQHYLAMYSQDGPHSLEIRRVEVLPHHAHPALAQPVGVNLKRAALSALSRADKDALTNPLTGEVVALRTILSKDQSNTIRRALEALPDD